MMILIMGRTSSGKTTMARLLKERGLAAVKSHTSRPRRTPDEDDYIFHDPSEVDAIDGRITETTINGYQYFTLKEDLVDKDFYIIDPIGMKLLAQTVPDETFTVLYIRADKETRKKRFLARKDATNDVETLFEARDASEDGQFSEFEKLLETNASLDSMGLPSNIRSITIVDNEDGESMEPTADSTAAYLRVVRYVTPCIEAAADIDVCFRNVEGMIRMYRVDSDVPEWVSPENFATILLNEPEEFGKFMYTMFAQSSMFKHPKNVTRDMMAKCLFMDIDKFRCIVKNIDECLDVTVDDDLTLTVASDANSLTQGELNALLSCYFDVNVTSVHVDASEYGGVWVCWR